MKNIFKITNRNNYNVIIVCDIKIDDLKDQIFKALKKIKPQLYRKKIRL